MSLLHKKVSINILFGTNVWLSEIRYYFLSLALRDLQWERAKSAFLPLLFNKYSVTLLVLSFNKTQAPKAKRPAHYFDDATKLWIWLLIKTLFLTIIQGHRSYCCFLLCTTSFRLITICITLPFVSIFFTWL